MRHESQESIIVQTREGGTMSIVRQDLGLIRLEFKILSVLLRNQGQVVPVETFFDEIYGQHWKRPNEKLIKTVISKIRRKLRGAKILSNQFDIESVWGRGYTVVTPNGPANPVHDAKKQWLRSPTISKTIIFKDKSGNVITAMNLLCCGSEGRWTRKRKGDIVIGLRKGMFTIPDLLSAYPSLHEKEVQSWFEQFPKSQTTPEKIRLR